MNGLNQLTASAQTIMAGGQTYRLAPLTLADYGEIENRILAARGDPLAELPPKLAERAEEEQRGELGRVFDAVCSARRVTLGDLDRWWQTPEGFCYRFWLMIRKDQPRMTLEASTALIRQIPAEDKVELARRMEHCHGWPRPWPPPAAVSSEAEDEQGAFPWHRWALELSRAYGWSPDEIGRMTIAQMCIYLGQAGESVSRQRMSLAEGVAACRQRTEDRERWIRHMMEELNHGP